MHLALNNLQNLICHKTPTNQPTNQQFAHNSEWKRRIHASHYRKSKAQTISSRVWTQDILSIFEDDIHKNTSFHISQALWIDK